MNSDFRKSVETASLLINGGIDVYGIISKDSKTEQDDLLNTMFSFKDIDVGIVTLYLDADNLPGIIEILAEAGFKGVSIDRTMLQAGYHEPTVVNSAVRRTEIADTYTFNKKSTRGYLAHNFAVRNSLLPYYEMLQHEDVIVFSGGIFDRMVLFSLLHNFNFPRVTLAGNDPDWCNGLLDEAEYWRQGSTILEFLNTDDWKSTGEYLWESRIIINCQKDFSENGLPESTVRFLRPGQVVMDVAVQSPGSRILYDSEKRGGQTIPVHNFELQLAAKTFNIWTRKVVNIDKYISFQVEDNSESGNYII